MEVIPTRRIPKRSSIAPALFNPLIVLEDLVALTRRSKRFVAAKRSALRINDTIYDLAVGTVLAKIEDPFWYNIPIVNAGSSQEIEIYRQILKGLAPTEEQRALVYILGRTTPALYHINQIQGRATIQPEDYLATKRVTLAEYPAIVNELDVIVAELRRK